MRLIFNQDYQYFRNVIGQPEAQGAPVNINDYPLMRVRSTMAGLRLVIQGWNTHDKLLFGVIMFNIGMCFIFLAGLPMIFNFFIFQFHPNRQNIKDA